MNKFSSIQLFLVLLLGAIPLSGCSGILLHDSGSLIISAKAEKPSPQAAGSGPINWVANKTEGLGEQGLTFELRHSAGGIDTVQQGAATTWSWSPDTPGNYQVRVTTVDASGSRSVGPWSEPYTIVSPLGVENWAVDRPSPQMAGTGVIHWTVSVAGGVGEPTIGFELEQDGQTGKIIQSGKSASWKWTPDQPGHYRVRAVVEDTRGNREATGWSEPYRIAPRLTIEKPTADKTAPQAARTEPVTWTVAASGGVGELDYGFELERDGVLQPEVVTGSNGTWSWAPQEPGAYRVRALVTDQQGNRQISTWSKVFKIVPPLVIKDFSVDRSSPQMATAGPITWRVTATGGVGNPVTRFELERDDNRVETVQSGPAATWNWRPDQAGSYRVRVHIADVLGNRIATPWSEPFLIAPRIQVEDMKVDHPTPQMAGTGPIIWSLTATGGVGELNVTFKLEKNGGTASVVQTGSSPSWSWSPNQAGRFRVRADIEDSLGNRVESSWYGPYRIAPPLVLQGLKPDKLAPQAARTSPIVWSAETNGGVEPLSYLFELEQDGRSQQVTDSKAEWVWQPQDPGSYRLRVSVTDMRGNKVISSWSEPYEIAPALVIEPPTAGISSPQVLNTVEIPWTVEASGGVGEKTISFEVSASAGGSKRIESGTLSTLNWRPEKPGDYRVQALMTDALGNQIASDWSALFRIEPPLLIETLSSDRLSPQAAKTVPILWQVAASGGVKPLTYAFELISDTEVGRFVQQGMEDSWQWQPETAGRYRVRATVTDLLGNRVQSDWTKTYEVVPPLWVSDPVTIDPAEQYLVHSKIEWQLQSSGGVGNKIFTFQLERQDGAVETVQTGAGNSWTWRPETAGVYRVQVLVVDALGNQRQSAWSTWKVIRLPLAITKLDPSIASPQPALQGTIRWSALTTGGVGTLTYEFRSKKDGIELIEQRGPETSWVWNHRKPGSYQVKVRVWDATEKIVETAWSDVYQITPAIKQDALIAVLPVENLTGRKVPLQEVSAAFSDLLQRRGVNLLSVERLEKFMHRHRMRYTGGISSVLAKALRDEEGVDAVVITSLESYSDEVPPQFALTSRLVICRDEPKIAWIEGVGLTGDDNPGLLSLKRISLVTTLREIAFGSLWDSLKKYLSGADESPSQSPDKLEPREHYRATEFNSAVPYKIAIVPFLNRYARRNAGFVVPLHLLNALSRYENLDIVEPGLVREQLLKYRLIMQEGPSLAVADVLSSPTTLEADLILSGYVFDYQDAVGTPKIDFSTRLFYGPKRKIVWWSRSYGTGSDGVYFYDVGRIWSTHVMMQQMSHAISDLLFPE